MSRYALGLDVGTTGVKAVLLRRDGTVRASGTANHLGVRSDAGLVEADPRRWWESARAAVGQLTEGVDDVAVIGLSGNMSSVVLLDAHHQVIANAPLLADNRGWRQLEALPAELSSLITERSLNRPATVFSLATLLWLRDEAPALLDRTSAWISAKDYLRLRLTGTLGTEITDAANSLLAREAVAGERHEAGAWDTELLASLGLPRRVFPELQPSGAVVGTVRPAAAADTGLPQGVPVIAGTGDMAATVLGVGDARSESDTLLVSLGTSMTVIACLPSRPVAPTWTGQLTYHPLPGGERGFALASLVTGGLAVNWLRDLLGAPALATRRRLDSSNPLVFLPHLAGTGTPDFRCGAAGTLVGLRPATDDADIVAALYEALAFELADVVRLTGSKPARRIVLTGGGTRLPAWTQTITDVLGRATETLDVADGSALGAARLAWAAIGETDVPSPATSGRLSPDPARAATLATRQARYRRARAAAMAYYDSEGPSAEADATEVGAHVA